MKCDKKNMLLYAVTAVSYTHLDVYKRQVDACKELCDICGIPSVSGYGIDLVEFRKAMPKMAEDAENEDDVGF